MKVTIGGGILLFIFNHKPYIYFFQVITQNQIFLCEFLIISYQDKNLS